jgi:hypothetical protein
MIKYIVNSLTDIQEEYYTFTSESEVYTFAKASDELLNEKIETLLLCQDKDNESRAAWIKKIRAKTITDITEATYDEDGEELTPYSENTYIQLDDGESEDTLLAEFIDYPTYDVNAWRLKNYTRLRKTLYGTWNEQLEMQADGTWDQHIIDVKARFPKPDAPIVEEETQPEVVISEGRFEFAPVLNED